MPINLARRSISVRCVDVALVVAIACASMVRAEDPEPPAGGRLLERLRKRQADTKSQLGAAEAKSPKHPGEEMAIAGLRVNVWRPAGEVRGAALLVIFSHGFHGGSTQSTFLMKTLADDGYLVVAPNHKDALHSGDRSEFSFLPEVGFGKPDDWTVETYRDRATDIQALFEALKDDQKWAGKIDWDKVALAGHSLGGYTVLGLSGGWPNWKPEGVTIRAVLALSPYCSPFIKKETLRKIDVPVMYQGGTRDLGITPFVRRDGGAFDLTAAPVYYIEFDKATHLAWTDLKSDYQKSINYYSLSFLNKHLKRGNVTEITRKLPDVSELRSK